MDNKTVLRIRAKSIRKNLDVIALSSLLTEKLRSQDYYKKAKNILIYYPIKYEINLLDLLNDDKCFYLPKVDGEDLYICPFNKNDELKVSSFNIKEPCSSPVNPKILDLILVPALMVDENNYRLGYGGGFYDRFLFEYPNITKTVLISEKLVVKFLPIEKHDIKADYVIKG